MCLYGLGGDCWLFFPAVLALLSEEREKSISVIILWGSQ